MSEKHYKVIVNCETGEQVTVPLTAEEIAQKAAEELLWEQQEQARLAAEQIQEEIKASALAKLTALGLTENEAKAIAG